MKSGEYFEKADIYGVNFDSGLCISMEYIHVKECIPQPSFIPQISIFCVKMGINGPLYYEICHMFLTIALCSDILKN